MAPLNLAYHEAFFIHIVYVINGDTVFFDFSMDHVEISLETSPGLRFMPREVEVVEKSTFEDVFMPSNKSAGPVLRNLPPSHLRCDI